MAQKPVFASEDAVLRDARFVARCTHRIPLAVKYAVGSTIEDLDGRKYTDLTSGWNVANTGWLHPRVVEAVTIQAKRLPFCPSWCTHPGRSRLAEALSGLISDSRAFASVCCVSGSEAIEVALSIARKATGRHAVVGFGESYHGRTLGSKLAGGTVPPADTPEDYLAWYRKSLVPDLNRFSLAQLLTSARNCIVAEPLPAAILLEPVFTNPGVLTVCRDFFEEISLLARQVGALLIVDEIGTGFARTGLTFGFQHLPLEPDIVVLGKAMGSGLVPISATMIREDLRGAVTGPESTFGWTPLACAAGLATVEVLESENLTDRSREMGTWAASWLRQELGSIGGVREIRGLGLEIAIELADQRGAPVAPDIFNKLLEKLLSRGVFVEGSRYTTSLMIIPPLTIARDVLRRALEVIVDEIRNLTVER